VEVEPGQKSLKSHMRRADKLGAAFVLILGEDELSRAVGVLRDLAAHEQSEIALDAERITARLRAGAAPSPRDDV
jgi:histidyl-tRNA synthetase